MIGAIRAQLRRLGAADNTYIVFSSDNGFHMGQRRLLQGKQTYWDHDVRVPLVVVGPGVPAAPFGHARGRERRPAADVPGARRRADRAARRGPQPGAVPARAAAGELARRDADRAPRAEPGDGDPDAQAPVGQPADLRRAAVRRRAVRAVRQPGQPARVLRPRARPARAAQHLPVAVAGAPGGAGREARADAGVQRRRRPATRPTPGRRVSPHAGDPDRRAQRP